MYNKKNAYNYHKTLQSYLNWLHPQRTHSPTVIISHSCAAWLQAFRVLLDFSPLIACISVATSRQLFDCSMNR